MATSKSKSGTSKFTPKRAVGRGGRSAASSPSHMKRRESAAGLRAELNKVQRMVDRLRDRVSRLNGHDPDDRRSTLEVWSEAGYIGRLESGLPDLSTNRKHMEGFGGS